MPLLIISALILVAGLGYWEYIRPKGPRTPQQVVADEAPALNKEILDLYFNGRDPQAMHLAASELEEYGFFDSAMLLHKRADQLAQMGAATPPAPGMPGAPAPTTQSALDAGIRDLRNEVGALDTQYAALNQQVQSAPAALSPSFRANWGTSNRIWQLFVVDFERSTASPMQLATFQNLTTRAAELRRVLISSQADFAREIGVISSVPQASPGPAAQAELPPGAVPTRFATRATATRSPILEARFRPDSVSAIITSIPLGGSVLVTSSITNPAGDFYLVNYQGQTGWVPKQFVSLGFDVEGASGPRRGIA